MRIKLSNVNLILFHFQSSIIGGNSGPGGGAGGGKPPDRTPLISIDICSDEDVRDHEGPDGDVVVKYRSNGDQPQPGPPPAATAASAVAGAISVVPGVSVTSYFASGKRHSTGDASADCRGFESALLGLQCGAGALSAGDPRHSTVSLYDPASAAVTTKKSGSRTAITDF